MLVSRSNVTSRIPKRCQSRSSRTRSCRTLPRPMWKHRVLLAGLMCRKRESQFFCNSGGPLRVAASPLCSGPRSKPERMEEELKFAVHVLSVCCVYGKGRALLTSQLERFLILLILGLLTKECEESLPHSALALSRGRAAVAHRKLAVIATI